MIKALLRQLFPLFGRRPELASRHGFPVGAVNKKVPRQAREKPTPATIRVTINFVLFSAALNLICILAILRQTTVDNVATIALLGAFVVSTVRNPGLRLANGLVFVARQRSLIYIRNRRYWEQWYWEQRWRRHDVCCHAHAAIVQ
jgi:hypothetical protein